MIPNDDGLRNIPGYRIVELISAAPNSFVYRGISLKSQKPVVLKTLNPKAPSLNRLAALRHEYEIIMTLRGKGLIATHGLEKYRNLPVLILEDIGGMTLSRLIRGGALEVLFCLEIFQALARQLALIHEKAIIHKDINPSHIIVNPKTGEVRLIDFSIATRLSSETRKASPVKSLEGTLAYISPEQTGRMNRIIDHRTDLYSLGISFYQALTGSLPFIAGDSLEMIHCHIAKPPAAPETLIRTLPRLLSNLVMKLMRKNAEDRYQSAMGLTRDLERCRERLRQHGEIPFFDLGERDGHEAFRIPQKLYGRESELASLEASFDRVAAGGSGMLLLAGKAGVGKSLLIHQIQKPLSRTRGYFISGKFDQFQPNIPHAPLFRAIQELVRQVLTESGERLARWKVLILRELGANCRVLADVIPEVDLIVGKLPPVPVLSPAESENRFHMAFRNFLGVFARKEHPLALFLDDLQWADSGTLKLLRLLLTKQGSPYLFLVGSYRDSEVSNHHPLMHCIEAAREMGANIEILTLQMLSREKVGHLIADTLHCDPPTVGPLADWIYQKTDGNPLFVIEFLKSLHDDGLFTFDFDEGRWSWDLAHIQRSQVTDNLLQFMEARIQRLPGKTQELLKLAACLGGQFDLEQLALVNGASQGETATTLWPAVKEGLVMALEDDHEPISERQESLRQPTFSYGFFHDRVQQATYSLIPMHRRKETHLRIGRSLLRQRSPERRESRLFAIVNQFQFGLDRVSDPEERRTLAAIYLRAGKKAKSATAYESAVNYFREGMRLLGPGRWRSQYEPCLSFHMERAECEYLSGSSESAEALFETILKHVRTPLDKAAVFNIRTVLYTHLGKYVEAIETGLRGLSLFGLALPHSEDQVRLEIERTLARVRLNLKGKHMHDLLDLPRLEDPAIQAMLEQLVHLWMPALNLNQSFLHLVTLTIVNLSLMHGNAGSSSYGYAGYGMFLGSYLGDFHGGFDFGKLGIELNQRLDDLASKCRVYLLHGAFVAPWSLPLKSSVTLLREAFQAGLDSGDFSGACSCMLHLLQQRMMKGDALHSLREEWESHEDLFYKAKDEHGLESLRVIYWMIRHLEGGLPKNGAEEDPFSQPLFLERVQRKLYLIAVSQFYMARTQIDYYRGNYAAALETALEAEKLSAYTLGWPVAAEHTFFSALCRAALWERADERRRSELETRLRMHLDQLERWAQACPENFSHRYFLISAECFRIQGDFEKAFHHYDRAIETAQEREFAQIEALARELAGRFFLLKGKARVARIYLQDAYFHYGQWGAGIKLNGLQEEFPWMRESMPATAIERRERLEHGASATEQDTGSLDLTTFMKASLAISSEIHLDRLLEKLLHFAIENAGAQRGFLIMEERGEPRIMAEGSVESERVRVRRSEVLGENAELSTALVNYVFHTKEPVVLRYASREGRFTSDAHILRNQVKSVLCQPVMYQGKLGGILYLENNLVSGAFTPQRLEVLRLLSSEAAISIENARLYANLAKASSRLKRSNAKLEEYNRNLEQKVNERTVELKVKNRELQETLDQVKAMQQHIIQKEKLASLGTLTAGIAHEIRNPLNFVNNFAEISGELVRELRQDLEKWSASPAEPGKLLQFYATLESLGQNFQKISEHGRRADSIVHAMLLHSHGSEITSPEPTDINVMLDEFVKLAYHGIRAKNVSFQMDILTDYDPNLRPIEVVPEDLSRVFLNIVDNACFAVQEKAARAGGDFMPELSVSTRDYGDTVEIRIGDNGGGIPEKILNKIFIPFFTTKPVGEGAGLGLSISYDIVVKEHQGMIGVTSEKDKYTEFVIQLPKKAGPTK